MIYIIINKKLAHVKKIVILSVNYLGESEMQISLYEFEVIEAVAQYCEKEHGINIDVNCIDGVSIEYQERERVFKKHKNGKTKMDEHGYPEVDWENSPSKTKYISLGEMSEMHISILSRDDI